MQSLNRKIPAFLLSLWAAMAVLGAIGYDRLQAVRALSGDLLRNAAPAVESALQTENAVNQVFLNTYYYCTYINADSKELTSQEVGRARDSLERYARLSQAASASDIQRLRVLVDAVEGHAIDCIQMTDSGMTTEEFGTHVDDLGKLQTRAATELRRAAHREQALMLRGTAAIDQAASFGLRLYLGGAVVLLIITLVAAYRMSRSILTPVSRLTEAAGRFSESDLRVRVERGFPGEFDVLAGTFNDMANRIESTLRDNGRLIETIRESREKFRDLYDNAPDGYHSVGPNGDLLEINATELDWLGYSRSDLPVGTQVMDLIAEPSRPTFQKAMARLRQEGSVEDLEIELLRKDETHLPVRVNSAAVFQETGEIHHSRWTLREITQEKELRDQLLQAQKLESIGTLAGGIAHDFNNLLTSMMGFSQLAMTDFDPKSRTYKNLDRVVSLGHQAAGLIRQLLTFSRQAPTEKQSTSLQPLVKETAKVLARTFPETIRIETRVDPRTPNVTADPTQMQQILMNLCVNARDAMPDGGALNIAVGILHLSEEESQTRGCPSGDWVRLSVSDSGTGIPREVQDRIFEPFFTTKEIGKGTGLGLSIVHGIVKSHDGFLTLHSEMGTGTEFELLLPVSQSEVELSVDKKPELPPGSETILIAEDDANVREIASAMLSTCGYRVLSACDGQQALAIYREEGDGIDLVISDQVMPGLSGTELGRQLHDLDSSVHVLLISGYSRQADAVKALPNGVGAGFLVKPFELHSLATAVRDALDGRAALA